ncbi:hypothetical protein DUY81_04535 [Acidipropionibacterium acidipropionici]|nr:hypothetical protein DUY81_04535 [Acidipropionibacterium acidipropionici]
MRHLVAFVSAALALLLLAPSIAWAESSIDAMGSGDGFSVTATQSGTSGGGGASGSGGGGSSGGGPAGGGGGGSSSGSSGSGGGSGASGGEAAPVTNANGGREGVLYEPTVPAAPVGAGSGPSAAQVRAWAVSAAASVRLPAPSVGVDPDPSVNRWHIVAVGQPLWLYDGSVARVTSTASNGGVTVAITAVRSSVSFDMGESVVRCTSMSRRPVSADPRAASPDCGYRYQKRGDRLVTATASWTVSWSALGQSGTLPMTRTASRTLPVRELLSVNVRPS